MPIAATDRANSSRSALYNRYLNPAVRAKADALWLAVLNIDIISFCDSVRVSGNRSEIIGDNVT